VAQPAPVAARWLTSILLEANVVKPEQVEAGLVRQRSTGLRIGETLVEMGAATEEDIGWALARQLNLPFVDLRPESLDRELIRSFPEGLLHRFDAVPLVNEELTLSIALADPTDSELVKELERAAGRPLTLAVATPSAIRSVLRGILGPPRDLHSGPPVSAMDTRFDVQWERSGASFLLFQLEHACRGGASEIHFLPSRGSLEVYHRIGGRLVRVGNEPPGALYYLLARLEALGGPVIDDRLAHVAGRIVCPIGGSKTMDLGVSLLFQEEGISVTLELRSVPTRLPMLEDLGFDSLDLAVLRDALEAPAGLGIVTGPPRSGGSTTLACLFAEIETIGRRCLAFGVPPGRVPTEVSVSGPAADATRMWGEVAVAQCADIVVLDGVLVGTAISAALCVEAAGRLLLVRTDWTDTFALLEYLSTRAQDRAALAARLSFVIQQRLLRAEHEAPSVDGSGLQHDQTAVFEVLVAAESLRAALRAGAPAEKLHACAEADGMRPLAARLKVPAAGGTVSATEAVRHLA
jgi:type II secretion system (T2SS) protein E/type II/IV secretion system protein